MANKIALWRHLLAFAAAIGMIGYLLVKVVLVWRATGALPLRGLDLAKFAGAGLVAPILTLFGVYLVTSSEAWATPEPSRGVIYNGKEYASMDEAMGKKKPPDTMKVAGGILFFGLAAYGFAIFMLLDAGEAKPATAPAPASTAPVSGSVAP